MTLTAIHSQGDQFGVVAADLAGGWVTDIDTEDLDDDVPPPRSTQRTRLTGISGWR